MTRIWATRARPAELSFWDVTLDPDRPHTCRTFEVPTDGLIAFIASAFERGTTEVILSNGKEDVLVSRLTAQ